MLFAASQQLEVAGTSALESNAFPKLGSLADSQIRKQTLNLKNWSELKNCIHLHPTGIPVNLCAFYVFVFFISSCTKTLRWPVRMGCLFGRSPCVQDLMTLMVQCPADAILHSGVGCAMQDLWVPGRCASLQVRFPWNSVAVWRI